MKSVFFSSLLILAFTGLYAQQHKSVHQEELEYYNSLGIINDAKWDSLFNYKLIPSSKSIEACPLNKIVFGWNPYWQTSQYNNFQWEQLSDLCYFSYEVNAANGNATSTHSWSTTPIITAAQNNGKRVHLCVTLFNSHATFLASSTAQTTLINNLIAALQQRNAIGINIDFEGVPSSQKANLTAFMKNLSQSVHNAITGSIISVCLPSVDWSPGAWDVNAMCTDATPAKNVDWFIIMGYDYYYGGSSQAGPTDPLYALTTGYNYCHSKSITDYLSKGVPKSKLILGLPYYGKEWRTASNTVPSSTLATGISVTYKAVKDNPTRYSAANKHWNYTTYTPYYTFFPDTTWKQCWIIDPFAYGKRLEMVNQMGIAGIGIWALGYDDGYTELWNILKDKFTPCGTVACSDTIYDMGGPVQNYYDKENYSYTIAPTGASSVSLTFSSFNTEANFDTLWLYDGTSATAPLIGHYTGTNSPGTVNSTGNAITLKFKADNSTNTGGWKAVWQCLSDNVAPTTTVSTTGGNWKTTDFTANFADADAQSGIEKGYYQVLDFNEQQWGANANRGFFADNFDTLMASVWTNPTGIWSSKNGNLYQSDSTNTNTNAYASLNQSLSNRYLYHFTSRLESAAYGTNQRRFGFHFFCDTASTTNRSNSYFIFYRQETSKLEIYKVVHNTFTLAKTIDNIITNVGQWYDNKIIFDRITGKISIYRDNIYLGSWTDTSPLTTNGQYISFRTGNCKVSFGELKVFRSRAASSMINIGTAASDIRFQNPSPTIHVAKIKSIANDAANNLSAIAYADLDVDWTDPTDIANVNDGLSSDADTTFINTSLSANWTTSADLNSGIAHYYYAIGTSAGATDIQNWTDNGTNLNCNVAGLNLTYGLHYYFSLKSQNGAGLFSNISTSDGIFIKSPMALPHSGFSYSITSVCAGVPVSFINESTNANTFIWQISGTEAFNSTDINPQIIFTTSGQYFVKLISTGPGGADSITQNISVTVYQLPVAEAGSNISVCEGQSVSLTASGGDLYQWNNGVTNGVSFSPLHTATYSVTVTDINNCSSIDSIEVAVSPNPTAVAGSDQTVCAGDSIALNATGGTNYLWDHSVANGVPFVPIETGIYTVTVTNAFNCFAISSLTVTVSNTPTASFNVNANSGQIPLTIYFTNTSQNATSYRWYMGDSTVLLGTNPYHIYQTAGNYSITLIAMNASCGNDTLTLVDYIHALYPVGITEIVRNPFEFTVFPNPVQNNANIEATLQQSGDISIWSENILTQQQELLFNAEVKEGTFICKDIIKSKTAPGVYFIKLYFNNELKGVQKIIKQ